jgi:hypothetical protein
MDRLVFNTLLTTLVLGIVSGFVVLYLQLITHRVYLPCIGAGTAGLFAAWWLVLGRSMWPTLSRDDRVAVFCAALLAACALSDMIFRVVNATFGGTARYVPAMVQSYNCSKPTYSVIVTMAEEPINADLSVARDTYMRLRSNQSITVVLHDGFLGDLWCRRDPVELSASNE